jgi:hypothetical protein
MIVEDAPADDAWEQRFQAAIAAERKADRQGARAFAEACRDGDVDRMLAAAAFLNDNTITGWRLAMRQIGRLPSVSPEIQAAFLNVWIEAKHLPLAVGHRPTMALHVLMPPVPLQEPLRLFRGAGALERQRGLYGFSWTTHREIAEQFADQARHGLTGSVLLETMAQPGSVHLRREDEGYYDESEVVVDPYRLGRVRILARLPALAERLIVAHSHTHAIA